ARLAQGHIGVAALYATDERAMTDRDELVVGVLGLEKASDAVLLAARVVESAQGQAAEDVEAESAKDEAEFRRVNGLAQGERVPAKLRGAFNALGRKDELRRRATRRSRDVLDRFLSSVASIYRDVAVLQNDAEDSVGLVNLENRSAITELSVRLSREDAVRRLGEIATARRRLLGNGNPVLVFEALFCALIQDD
ncbi:MAG: DNA polymerase III subunit delta', partial [Bifidobacterium sp.]